MYQCAVAKTAVCVFKGIQSSSSLFIPVHVKGVKAKKKNSSFKFHSWQQVLKTQRAKVATLRGRKASALFAIYNVDRHDVTWPVLCDQGLLGCGMNRDYWRPLVGDVSGRERS